MAARSPATTLSSRAYLKLILHAAKYQTRACMGLLIGHTEDAASSSSSRPSTVRVTDVLPLFHTAPLAPMIELALAQAEHIVRNSGQYAANACIAGLYYAPEHFDARQTNSNSGESTLPMPHAAVVVKMAEKIAANAGGAAGSRIILVSNGHNKRYGCLAFPAFRPSCPALLWAFLFSSARSFCLPLLPLRDVLFDCAVGSISSWITCASARLVLRTPNPRTRHWRYEHGPSPRLPQLPRGKM
jgi:hypothetical protein